MNNSMRFAVVSLAVLGLAACTGMQERPGSAYVAPQRTPSITDSNALYMAHVERIARRRGIDVVWVNPPRRSLGKNAVQ